MVKDEADKPGVIAPPPFIYLFFLILGLAIDFAWPLAVLPAVAQYAAGAALIVPAVAILAATVRRFRRAKSSFDVRKPATALLTDGPFRFSRNPIYVAMSLAYAGLAVAIDSPWILALLAPALVVMRYGVIGREERYLERKFGDEYRRYKGRARRWI